MTTTTQEDKLNRFEQKSLCIARNFIISLKVYLEISRKEFALIETKVLELSTPSF